MIMKRLKIYKNYLICVISFLIACYSNRLVPFEILNSEMEVSQEENGQITFRSFYKQNAFQSIVDAILKDSVVNNEQVHCLFLLYGPYVNNDSNKVVDKIPYGIKVTLSGRFNFKEDKFYYCDNSGCHEIEKGTISTWESKVKNYLDKNNVVY